MTSYAYLLKFIVQEIPGLSISCTGGIYLPPFHLQEFCITPLLSKIDGFFRTELPRIITTSKLSWHYNLRCKTCYFANTCRKEAEGTIAMIPYLSYEKAKDLKTIIQDWKSGDEDADIEDLAKYLNDIDINDQHVNTNKVKQIVRYDKKLKTSPYLKVKPERAQVCI